MLVEPPHHDRVTPEHGDRRGLVDIYEPEDDETENYMLSVMKKHNLFAATDPLEISNDLCLRSMITTCLDFDYVDSMIEIANSFVETVLSQPRTPHNTNIMLSLFDRVKQMKVPLKQYGNFFKGAFSASKNHSTLAQPLEITFWKY